MRRMLAAALCVALIISILFPVAGIAAPDETPPGQDQATVEQQVLDEINAKGETTFLVYLKDRPSLDDLQEGHRGKEQRQAVVDRLRTAAGRSQGPIKSLLDDGVKNGKVKGYKAYWIVNCFSVTGDKETLDKLSKRPEVDRIEAQHAYHIDPAAQVQAEASVDTAMQWNIGRIKADRVWALARDGDGVVVGSLDTGVQYDHPALVRQYRGNLGNGTFDHNYNWFDATVPISEMAESAPYDDHGHGTHTMGTILGDDGGSNKTGVAPGAKWIAAKVFDISGTATEDEILAGFQWMLAPTDLNGNNPDPSKAPDVVNNSWGSSDSSDTAYQEAVKAWVAAGIVPVFAAGNNGPGLGTINTPGAYPQAFAVGATNGDDQIASFSSRGPAPTWMTSNTKPDVSAPGVNVRSSIPGSAYGFMDGTSMAAPEVTGLVALLLQVQPTLTVTRTEKIIRDTAVDLGQAGPDPAYGWGRINALAAVRSLLPTGTVKGTVSKDGKPVTGAIVTARLSGCSSKSSTLTDATGAYTLTLGEGTYDVTANGGYRYFPGTDSVLISGGTTRKKDFNLVLKPVGTIAGTVREEGTGAPISATITLPQIGISTSTDPSTGAYQLPPVTAGDYSLSVTPDLWYPEKTVTNVAVVTDTVTPQDVVLPRRALYDSFDPVANPWTHEAIMGTDHWYVMWGSNHSPMHSYFASAPASVNDDVLVSRVFTPTSDSQLTFWHTYSLEGPCSGSLACDGAVIEISTDGGALWTDLGPYITSGGYNYTISSSYGSPIGGRRAWSGGTIGSMTRVDVDLSSFAGEPSQIRFRLASDEGVYSAGWAIDDVSIYGADVPVLSVPTGTMQIDDGAGYTGSRAVAISVASANATHVKFRDQGSPYWSPAEPVGTTRSWTLPPGDGTKVVEAGLTDGVSPLVVVSASITLDTHAPVGSISINGGAATTGSITATLNLSATDATPVMMRIRETMPDGTVIRDSGTWMPYAGSYTWRLWDGPDGTRTIQVHYEDTVGNISGWLPSTIRFVRGKPSLISPVPNAVLTDTTRPTFSWSPVTDASAYQVVVKRADTGILVWRSPPTTATGIDAARSLARGVRYKWRVRAFVDGTWTAPPFRYFKVK